MTNKYVAYPWPEYQEYMGEEWFRKECYYCADKDVYFIPINRINTTSTNTGLSINDICIDIESMVSSYKQRLKNQGGIRMENNPLVNMFLIAFRHGVENTLEELNLKKLEKQGKQETLCDKCRKEHPSHSCQDITELGRCVVEHEQKTADKVKPKFKVGDWVVFDNGNVERIISVGTHGYTFDDGDYLLHDKCNKIAHLWSLQDAKDGDILAFNDETIVIFKNLYNKTSFHSYCHIEDGIFTVSKEDMPDWWEGEGFYPATKEQCDLLFAKMKEDGYKWDAEKKEVKKIKNEIEIPFGAKDSELQEATYYIPKGFHAEIDDDKVVIKKGEKPTTWSEDDEHIRKRLISLVNEIYDNTNYITFLEHKELLAWLEKLDDNIEL